MKRHHKLSQLHDHQAAAQQQQTASEGSQEFGNADDVLRYDASQTAVPPDIARRLQISLGTAPSKVSWWKKLFG
jgi:hypothetical protein